MISVGYPVVQDLGFWYTTGSAVWLWRTRRVESRHATMRMSTILVVRAMRLLWTARIRCDPKQHIERAITGGRKDESLESGRKAFK